MLKYADYVKKPRYCYEFSLLLVYYLLLTEFVQYVINRGFIHQQHVIFG
jgi:hypothetical protein